MKTPLQAILLIIFSALLFSLLSGCGATDRSRRRMDRAEKMMESDPDSAMRCLDSVASSTLFSKKEKARYALLKSMALDKNFIDTITFDVLQPALDYYLEKGTPDERLRTLYYQGRIFQNRKEDEEAMKCFIMATELKDQITDSLTLGRLYYTKSLIYYKTHRYESYINSALAAAELYRKKKDVESEQLCMIFALEGAIIIESRFTADSLKNLLYASVVKYPSNFFHLRHALILYANNFLSDKETKILLDSLSVYPTNENIKLDMALAYSSIGVVGKAKQYLDSIAEDKIEDPKKYYSIKKNVMENIGNIHEAYKSLLNYQNLWESEMTDLLSADILFLEKKYELEKKALEEKERTRTVWFSAVIISLSLLLILLFVYLRLRTSELKRLKTEKMHRELEKDNALLTARLTDLISERDRLQSMMSRNPVVSDEITKIIKARLKVLDELIASHITADEKSLKKSLEILRKTTRNKREFLKSTRQLYQTLYPSFMEYLIENNLTDQEIDYICLQILGLRSKEIGEFLNTSRHYHISSAIRAKLGLIQNDTNLSVFILSKFK